MKIKLWDRVSPHITAQRIRLFTIALFSGTSLALWWVGYTGWFIFFEFGIVVGLNVAFYIATLFDTRQAANFRAIEENRDDWRKLAFEAKDLAGPLHVENQALQRVLREVGFEVTVQRNDTGKEIQITVEPLHRPGMKQEKPTLH